MNHATVVRTGRSRFGALAVVAALAASVGLTVGSTAPSLALAPSLSSLAITPTAFDFGDVPVGSTSATQLVTVTNVSGASMVLSASGGAAGVFGGSSDCNFAALAPGASCHLYYQFSPTVAGAQTGSAVGTVQGQFFSLTFKGNGVNQFLFTPAGFDFGDVAVGTTSAQQVVTVTNVGNASVVGSLSGLGAGVFGSSSDCNGATIAPGASCHIYFTFTPTAATTWSGGFSSSMNGQPFNISFTGNAYSGAPPSTLFAISPTTFDFGDVPVGSSSTQQLVTVTNISGASIVMSVAGGGAGVFGGSSDCEGLTLAAGASCHVSYQFSPTVAGPQTGTATASFNGQVGTFNFIGNGVNPFLISPTGFDFGDVPVGSSSAKQSVTVTNVSGSPILLSSVGGGAGVFGGHSYCVGTLAAGASCHVSYRFSPTVAGPQTGTATGAVNGQTYALSFTGNAYTAGARPKVTHITPAFGPTAGGTLVHVSGTGFTGATKVVFGGAAAPSFTVLSSTQLTAVSPAVAPGVHNIYVITPGGTSAPVLADLFTYVARPVVTHISPSSGPHAGGTTVTITGTGFTGATEVLFSGTAATHVTVVSSTKITARSPAESAGVRNVLVITPGGISAVVSADRFTYH
jgi:ribosomal protein S11